MSQTTLTIEEIPLGHPHLKEFVRLPWRLYRGDPCWTPPLNADYLGNPILGMKGLLTPNHPYHQHAQVTHFLARRGNEPVGRVSAAVNSRYNEYHHTELGFFGLFETINDYEVARALLDRARDWVAARGMKVLRGPGEYSNATHERQGILVDGFQHPPTVECTHNPPYYGEFLEHYGFHKAKDYVAVAADPTTTVDLSLLEKLARRASRHPGITTRGADMKHLREEVALIVDIYNEAWAANWGFLPITSEEGDAIADTLRLIIDPALVRFAYVNGQSAAVLGLMPDPNCALRPRWRWYGDSDFFRVARLLLTRRRLPRTRAMFFGIRPAYRMLGIPAILAHEIAPHYMKHGYGIAEGSLLLEDNEAILKVTHLFGARYYKRWRIYDLPL